MMVTPENIPEFSTFEEIIQYAMDEEKNARDFYVKASDYVHDPDLKAFLLELADLEVQHYETLREKLEQYKANRFSMKGIMLSFGEGVT